MAGVLDRLKKKMMEEEVGEIVNLLIDKLDKMIELLEEMNNTLKRIEKGTRK